MQPSTTLPTDQYMLSNYIPTVALVITSLFGDYVIIHHSNHPSFSKHAIRTFNIQRNEVTQEHVTVKVTNLAHLNALNHIH